MNRIDRLTAILIRLQTRRVVTAGELAKHYGISLRTVYRDVRALEQAGVPIGAEPGKGYFLAEGFHLPPVMFTQAEAGALLLGAKLIEKFGDPGIIQQFAGALDKIKAVLGQADQDFVNRLDDHMTVLNAPPAAPAPTSPGLLTDIQPWLADSRVIRLGYHAGYKDEHTERRVEPLGLCYYAGSWHLLAYCHLRKDYRDFRLDRITSVAVTGECFDRGRHVGLKKLVQRMVTPQEMLPVKVVFTRPAASMVQEQKYYFGFVAQKEVEEGIEMEFLVPNEKYISYWLLSFVDQVTITAPQRLKQIMAEHVRRLGDHY